MAAAADPLDAVVGRNVAQLRRPELTQDQVAAAARRAGLSWTQATVAAIETGRRNLSVSELVLLPLLLSEALRRPVEMAELVACDADVSITATVRLPSWAIEEALSSAPRASWDFLEQVGATFTAAVLDDDRDRMNRTLQTALRRRLPDGVSAEAVGTWDRAAEAVRHAARRLEVGPHTVNLASAVAWGCSLTDERERRLQARLSTTCSAPDARGLQAVRGRITRELLDELGQLLASIPAKRS